MDRVAILVDVGYVCTGGAWVLEKRKCARLEIRTDIEALFNLLETKSQEISGLPLLRLYWYDGSVGGRVTTEQTLAGQRNHIKLRLGIVNGLGEQKEVDTKLVTDLAELARNRAIADAILVGGDGDLRLGVEIAQQYGVKVHLVTIQGTGVSEHLKMEADTWNQISMEEVKTFISISRPLATPSATNETVPDWAHGFRHRPLAASNSHSTEQFDAAQAVQSYLLGLSVQDKNDLKAAVGASSSNSIPADHDGRLLAASRGSLGRDLDGDEKKRLRKELKKQLTLNK